MSDTLTTIVAIFLASIASPMWILKSILLAISVTVVEAVSIKGTDNSHLPKGIYIVKTDSQYRKIQKK